MPWCNVTAAPVQAFHRASTCPHCERAISSTQFCKKPPLRGLIGASTLHKIDITIKINIIFKEIHPLFLIDIERRFRISRFSIVFRLTILRLLSILQLTLHSPMNYKGKEVALVLSSATWIKRWKNGTGTKYPKFEIICTRPIFFIHTLFIYG